MLTCGNEGHYVELIWEHINLTRNKPMTEKNGEFALGENISLLNETKTKEEKKKKAK